MKRWFNAYGPTVIIVALIVGSSLWAGFKNGWN
jgi:hypothetical protein